MAGRGALSRDISGLKGVPCLLLLRSVQHDYKFFLASKTIASDSNINGQSFHAETSVLSLDIILAGYKSPRFMRTVTERADTSPTQAGKPFASCLDVLMVL